MRVFSVEEEMERAARRRVRAQRGLNIHAMIYAAIMSFLVFINVTTGGEWWMHWPAIGWGLGLVIHAMFATNGTGLFGRDWEERKVQDILQRWQDA
jgi:hypothetical protein